MKAALKAKATPILDEATRREVYTNVLQREGRLGQVEARVQRSNLLKIDLLDT